MTHGRSGRRALIAACLLALVGSGCTPDVPPPDPPSPSAATPTPTENAQEREERLAYAAAEKSYREFRAEYNRVLSSGGSSKATSRMKATAGGDYLRELQEVSAAYRGLHHYSKGAEKIDYVQPEGYEPNELVMNVCEDSRNVLTFDSSGKRLYAGDLRQLHLIFRVTSGVWKVWTGSGKKVSACV